MSKSAKTQHDIEPVLAERWSPRAFSDRPVEREKLLRLFEAARWAASSFNEQPWRFFVATRDQPELYEKILSCMVEFNQQWARTAPVVMLSATRTLFKKNNKPNRVHLHDLGLAMGNLSAQATAMGLYLHQMAGIDRDKMRQVFELPDDVEPQTGCAIGYLGDPAQLPESMREKEGAERTRLAFEDFVYGERFGQASSLIGDTK